LRVIGARGGWRGGQDKGHRAELEEFVRYVTKGGRSPIPPEEMIEVSRASFEIHRRQLKQ